MSNSIKSLKSKSEVSIDDIKDTLNHSFRSRSSIKAGVVFQCIENLNFSENDLTYLLAFLNGNIVSFHDPKFLQVKDGYVKLSEMLVKKIKDLSKENAIKELAKRALEEKYKEVENILETPKPNLITDEVPQKRGRITREDILLRLKEKDRLEEEKIKGKAIPAPIEIAQEVIKSRVFTLLDGLSQNTLNTFKYFKDLFDKNEKGEFSYTVSKKELITLKGYLNRMKTEFTGKMDEADFKILKNVNSRISNIANTKPRAFFKEIQGDFDRFILVISKKA